MRRCALGAVPVFIAGAVLVIAPALWSRLRHSFADDPIAEPGSVPSARSARNARVFIIATNWMLVPGTVALSAMTVLMDSFSR